MPMQTMSHATAINTIYLSEYIEVKRANLQQHKADFAQGKKIIATGMTTKKQIQTQIYIGSSKYLVFSNEIDNAMLVY